MGVTQDGYAGNQGGGNATGGSVTVSTTNSNDVVELVIFAEGGGHSGSPHTVATVTSPHLTWTLRARVDDTVNDRVLEKWYAVAASPLTNEVISFTFSSQLDDWAAIARGWSGVNTTTPYDPNASLPASTTHSGTTISPSVGSCSTTAINTVMVTDIGSAAGFNNFPSGTVPSGWTYDGTQAGTGGGNFDAECAGAYQIETSVQSNLTVTWNVTMGQFIMMVDALQAVVTPGQNAKSQAVSVGF